MTPGRHLQILGPSTPAAPHCERILRSLPRWFGIEASLQAYVADSERFPTFFAVEDEPIGFLTVREHFRPSWEVHCIGVHADRRGTGVGRALHAHVERWVQQQGAQTLQVKTLAASHPSAEYAETRDFYTRMGYLPVEVFPTLWGPHLPVLQLIKSLAASAS